MQTNKNKYDVAIMNFWPFPNFGGVISSYAIQQIIYSLGYSSKLINYVWPSAYSSGWTTPSRSFVPEFAARYLDVTKPYYQVSELRELNQEVDTFVFGTDCIWSHFFLPGDVCSYFGDWVDIGKRKIAFAASFGSEEYQNTFKNCADIKFQLSSFHRISTREASGVKILKDVFNIEGGVDLLEPSFLLDRSYYEKIIEEDVKAGKEGNGVLYYAVHYVDPSKEKHRKDIFSQLFDDDIIFESHWSFAVAPNRTMGQWLNAIKNCRLLITDSFHAMCFALIFNKPVFVMLEAIGVGGTRFFNVLKHLGLEDRILTDGDELVEKYSSYKPINWDHVNSVLATLKMRSMNWLKEALATEVDLSDISNTEAVIHNLQNKVIDLQNQLSNRVDELSRQILKRESRRRKKLKDQLAELSRQNRILLDWYKSQGGKL